jgi:hypothetical protein
MAAKAESKSRSVLALSTWSSSLRVRAAACTCFDNASPRRLVGLTSSAMMRAVGTNSCSSSSRFGPISVFNEVAPVKLPPVD